MKKNLIMLILVVVLGVFSGKTLYTKINDVYAKSNQENIVYMLQLGVYKDEKVLNRDTNSIDNKLIIKENNNYYVYIGISYAKDNLQKISNIYNKLGYNLYIKEKEINNQTFLTNLTQFDLLLKTAETNDEIEAVNAVILSSYEEMVLKN